MKTFSNKKTWDDKWLIENWAKFLKCDPNKAAHREEFDNGLCPAYRKATGHNAKNGEIYRHCIKLRKARATKSKGDENRFPYCTHRLVEAHPLSPKEDFVLIRLYGNLAGKLSNKEICTTENLPYTEEEQQMLADFQAETGNKLVTLCEMARALQNLRRAKMLPRKFK